MNCRKQNGLRARASNLADLLTVKRVDLHIILEPESFSLRNHYSSQTRSRVKAESAIETSDEHQDVACIKLSALLRPKPRSMYSSRT